MFRLGCGAEGSRAGMGVLGSALPGTGKGDMGTQGHGRGFLAGDLEREPKGV